MLGINFGVFDDEKSFKTGFVTIKPSPVPFFAIFGHFLPFLVGQIMVLLGVNLGFLEDEKSFQTSFRMNKQSLVPFCAIFVPQSGIFGRSYYDIIGYQFRVFWGREIV